MIYTDCTNLVVSLTGKSIMFRNGKRCDQAYCILKVQDGMALYHPFP